MIGRMLWIAMLTAAMAFAQRGGGGGGMADGAMPRVVKLTKAEMFADQLKLSKEQREQAQEILNDTLKAAALLRMKIDEVRKQIVASIINGDNQDEIKKATDALTAAEVQLTGLEARSFAQVCALLKPNQQSRAAAAFDLWAAVLDPPGSAGRGGFNAGGRRGRE